MTQTNSVDPYTEVQHTKSGKWENHGREYVEFDYYTLTTKNEQGGIIAQESISYGEYEYIVTRIQSNKGVPLIYYAVNDKPHARYPLTVIVGCAVSPVIDRGIPGDKYLTLHVQLKTALHELMTRLANEHKTNKQKFAEEREQYMTKQRKIFARGEQAFGSQFNAMWAEVQNTLKAKKAANKQNLVELREENDR